MYPFCSPCASVFAAGYKMALGGFHQGGVKWCKRGFEAMPLSPQKKKLDKSVHRLSVSLTPEQRAELLEIANKNKVSVAWVVREAIERLLRDEHPLFHAGQSR